LNGVVDRVAHEAHVDTLAAGDARTHRQSRVLWIALPPLLGGVIVVEQVFSLPGLGYDSVNAISTGNLPVIIGFVIVAAAFVVIANILVDLSYALLDPRVRIT
jgi:ABC-type dipeptide/oligopeptide/nickel transport system permease component